MWHLQQLYLKFRHKSITIVQPTTTFNVYTNPDCYFSYRLNNKSGSIIIFLSILICVATVNSAYWVKILGKLMVEWYMKSILYAVQVTLSHSRFKPVCPPPFTPMFSPRIGGVGQEGSEGDFLSFAAAPWGFRYGEGRGAHGLGAGMNKSYLRLHKEQILYTDSSLPYQGFEPNVRYLQLPSKYELIKILK